LSYVNVLAIFRNKSYLSGKIFFITRFQAS
jgi:hypothetical protein